MIYVQNSQVAERVKKLCINQNVAISDMLQKCKITKSLIYDMEKRDRTPSADIMERIADYFGVSIDYLLGRTDNPEINR